MCLRPACVKYCLFFFNLAFLFISIAFIAAGIMLKIRSDTIAKPLEDFGWLVEILSMLIIVIGAMVSLISFLGCCGSIKESPCMLVSYGIILLLLFAAQLVLGTLICANLKETVDEVEREVHGELDAKVRSYWNPKTSNESRRMLDSLQRDFECCGARGYEDWTDLPLSCCGASELVRGVCPSERAFRKGCVYEMSGYMDTSMKIVVVVAVSIAGVELLASVVAFYLTHSIRMRRREI